MLIKVCGMREPENIQAIAALQPDAMGFIFFERSKRFVGDILPPAMVRELPASIRTVGVFVNADTDTILRTRETYRLNVVQLHGDETPSQVAALREIAPYMVVWKAFGLAPGFDFAALAAYEPHCQAFLFDTKTTGYGGSGQTFDWSMLAAYQGEVPYWLSGGLGLPQVPAILSFAPTARGLVGVDLNSQLEESPGLKSVAKTRQILRALRGEQKI